MEDHPEWICLGQDDAAQLVQIVENIPPDTRAWFFNCDRASMHSDEVVYKEVGIRFHHSVLV